MAGFRSEVSRLTKIANKRLKRLKLAGYEETPAYRSWLKSGGVFFGVKGKTNKQVQAEFRRVKKFLDDRTSTIRGANKVLREIARAIGYKNATLRVLKVKIPIFFSLAQKISEYNKLAGNAAKALDYQKIWQEIRELEANDRIRLDVNKDALDWPEYTEKVLQEYIEGILKIFNN